MNARITHLPKNICIIIYVCRPIDLKNLKALEKVEEISEDFMKMAEIWEKPGNFSHVE